MPYVTVDSDFVSELLEKHPVTRDDLHAIRDPRNPDRFQGVYGHRHGGINRGNSRFTINYYRARVFKFFELGSGFESPEEAARAVVAFYKAHYGDRWRRAFQYRKVIPWRLRPLKSGEYAVELFVRGQPVGITEADADGRSAGASERWTWRTSREAKRAARRAMDRRFARERAALPIPAPGLVFWRG